MGDGDGGAFLRRGKVASTPELRRIAALPRRTWTEAQLAKLAEDMTEVLRQRAGTWKLRPIQALALYEIGTYGGLFGPIRVGGGKTLVSLLAPYVLEAKRPLLLLPAALVAKTERERHDLIKQFRIPLHMRIHSYEMLGREKSKDYLALTAPDLIIADEAHRLKNRKAGVTRRVVRYMAANPGTKFVAISGTVMKASLRDFAHILRWCMPPDGAPIPSTQGEVEEWADALDERINPLQRMGVGALLELASPEDQAPDQLTTARRAFRRRLTETPGVVATSGEQVACSLYVRALPYTPNPVTDANFRKLRTEWRTPDDWDLSEAVAVWRHARELALGLHYVWDPRPPESWTGPRRLWAKFVRDTLAHSHKLDTELQVAKACAKGDLPDVAYKEWVSVRDTFVPNARPVWHDSAALEACAEWMKAGPGIVWCEHTFFAEELARRTGVPYFGANGVTDTQATGGGLPKGTPIEKADPRKPLIASIAANSTGRNLQGWSRNLITSCMTGAHSWEQLLGRTHRDGQLADEVTADVLVGCFEHVDAFAKALADARMASDMLGHTQKLLIADVDMPSPRDAESLVGWRWRKTSDVAKDL